jgi:gluconate 2-dehydrogenase gamma chain
MPPLGRRAALKLVGAAPLVAGFALGEAQAQSAHAHVRRQARRGRGYEPQFFTPHEWAAVRLLADLVIPADERSGSAGDALVPEFMDTILVDDLAEPRERERNQTAMRGGLAWLERRSAELYGKSFVEAGDAERRALLDEIAWPEKAPPALSQGVAFFDAFRDLTASGFWSSKLGVDDLEYTGNAFVPRWTGCPPQVLRKLGLEAEEG